tara:strand:- start:266 stop:463 length:198 start_codon:yes stop_codon:yes gene_type:complete
MEDRNMQILQNLLIAIHNYNQKDLDNINIYQWGMIKYYYKHDLINEMLDYIKNTVRENKIYGGIK